MDTLILIVGIITALALIGSWLTVIWLLTRDLERQAPPRAAGLKGKEVRLR